jgi:hypothetical protein
MNHTHSKQATPVNKLGMWGLNQDVSIVAGEAIIYVQYLGDVGEVGEVGEYFGEAGVINAGARDGIRNISK